MYTLWTHPSDTPGLQLLCVLLHISPPNLNVFVCLSRVTNDMSGYGTVKAASTSTMSTCQSSEQPNHGNEDEDVSVFTDNVVFTTTDLAKAVIFGVFLVPIRLALLVFLLTLSNVLTNIILWNMSDEDLTSRPLTGWRQTLATGHIYLSRSFACLAGIKLTIVGEQATRKEAPIIVFAPHASLLDAMMPPLIGTSGITRHQTMEIPGGFGNIAKVLQSYFVDRGSSRSKEEALKFIKYRALSPMDWSQVMVYPEGTTTNGTKLIHFKRGAFVPGVPVQPLLCRFPGKGRVNLLTDVFIRRHSPVAMACMMLSRPVTHIEVEFLPVYYPNEDERRDPRLYAHNVQSLMAKKLGIPATEIRFEKMYKWYFKEMDTQKIS